MLAGQTSMAGQWGSRREAGLEPWSLAAQTAKLPLPRWQRHVPCVAGSSVWESQALSKLGDMGRGHVFFLMKQQGVR